MPPVVVRVLMYMYEEQYAWVRWGQARSDVFKIVNGTRQGAIASPDLWSVYLDPLLKNLRRLGVDCHVGNLFIGVLAYADVLLLLAPNREAGPQMLALCEAWAKENNVQFSTDKDPKKSKCNVSGLKCNVSKTKVIPVGNFKIRGMCEYLGLASTDHFTILGVYIDNKLQCLDENFNRINKKIRGIISRWTGYNLSFHGKITVCKTLLL